MNTGPTTTGPFLLGPWRVRPSLLELHRDGEVRTVGPKVMDTLLCLAARPGEAISKDELIEAVWQGAFTTDEALTTVVYELRKALDDDARRPKFVGTIRGRGYRLLVEPEPVPAAEIAEGIAEDTAENIAENFGAESEPDARADDDARADALAPGASAAAPGAAAPKVGEPGAGEPGAGAQKPGAKPAGETEGQRGPGLVVALGLVAALVLGLLALAWLGNQPGQEGSAGEPPVEEQGKLPGEVPGEVRAGGPGVGVPAPEDSFPSDPALDNPALGDPALGDPALGDTALEDAASDDTAFDRPASEGRASEDRAVDVAPRASPERASPFSTPDPEAPRSVTIMPLVAEESDVFAESLAERLAVDLSRLGGLEIVPGFSPVVDLGGSNPGTDAVVEGSVRRQEDRVAVSIRLVDRTSGRMLWGGNYEEGTDDLRLLQRQISLEIARQVRDHLAPRARTPDPRAEEAFRLGDYFLGLDTPSGRAKAVDYFRLAIDRDPGWASAHAGLAEAWIESAPELPSGSQSRAYDRAKEAAEAALVLDDGLPEAHASLGSLYFHHFWDWSRAEEHFRLGCPPDTCSAEDAPRYAAFLSAMGRHEEALAVLEGSLVHDPASKRASLGVARALYLARHFERARLSLERARELDPDHPPLLRLEVEILLALGRDARAVAVLERLLMAEGIGRKEGASLGEIFRRDGLGAVLRRVIDGQVIEGQAIDGPAGNSPAENRQAENSQATPGGPLDPFWLASLEARLGRADAALAWLRRAFEERHEDLVWIRVHPAFDPLRHRPELKELIDRLELGPRAVSGPS